MSTVQWPLRSVNSHINVLIATHAEDDFLASGLMHWAVTNDPRVSVQQIFMKIDDFAEVRRACFLFALENEFEVERWRDSLRAQRVERGEDSHHSCLVV